MQKPQNKSYNAIEGSEQVQLQKKTTKSMEQQNQLPVNKNKNWLNLSAIILVIGGVTFGGWYWSHNRQQNSALVNGQSQPVAVKFITLESEKIKEITDVLGSLEASQTVQLKPEIEGRLTDILITEGQMVNQNDILFRLDTKTLEAQLKEAQANLASRQAQLTELETGNRSEDIAIASAKLRQAKINLTNAVKGASPEEIASAKAQLESATAEANLAQQKVERFRNLEKEGAISADQFDDILTSAKMTTANVEQAKRGLQQLQQANNFNIKQLETQVDEAEQNLLLLQNGARKEEIDQAKGEVASAKANVERLESLLAKNAVKAPITGKIGNIPVNIGDYLESDNILTTITQNNLLKFNFSLPIEKLSDLELDLPVQLLDNQKQVIAVGKISFISPNVTTDSQLVTAQAIFNNVDSKLLNNQFVTARIVWDTNTGVLVPTSAIFRIGSQSFVFVVKSDSSGQGLMAEQRNIKLGTIQGNSYEVLDGLETGEKIVTEGILQLRDGSPIKELSEGGEKSR